MDYRPSPHDDRAILDKLDFPTPRWPELDVPPAGPTPSERTRCLRRRTLELILVLILLLLSAGLLVTARGVAPVILLIAACGIWLSTLIVVARKMTRLVRTAAQAR